MNKPVLGKILAMDRLGLGFLTVAVIIFCSPFLIFGKIFFDGDAIGYFYPYASLIHSHGMQIWSPGLLAGFSLAASFQFGFFSPLYRLFFLLPNFMAGYGVAISIYFLLAGSLAYLFCRKIGMSVAAATLAASSYSLAQFNVHWAGNISVISSLMILPAAFLGVWSAFFGNKRYLILFGAILGVSFLSAHEQFILMSIFAAGFYGIYYSWVLKDAGETWSRVVRPWLFLLGTFVAGVIIGLPQLLYTARFTAFSGRSGGLSYALATVDASTPLDYIKYFLPNFNFRYGISQEFLPYVGVIALVLGIVAGFKLFKTNNQVRFFSLTYLFVLLAAVKYSPIFYIFTKFPVLSYFRGPARWMFVGNFAMAILAGWGIDYVYADLDLRKRLGRFISWIAGFFVVCGIAATSVFIFWGGTIILRIQNWFDLHQYSKTTGLPLDYYHQIISDLVRRSFGNFNFTNPLFLVAVAFMILAAVLFRYIKSSDKFIIAILIVSSANLVWAGYNSFAIADASIIQQQPELSRVIHDREGDTSQFRIFSFLISMASSQKISEIHPDATRDGLQYALAGFVGNSNLLWGFQTVDGYEPMSTARSQRLSGFIGSEDNKSTAPLSDMAIPLADKIKLFSSRLPLLSMMNVKYLVSAYPLPSSPRLSLVHTAYVTRFKIPIYLYENKAVLPRVYLAKSVTDISSNDETAFTAVTNPTNDFSKTTYLECQDCEANTVSAKDSLSIIKYTDGLLVTKVSTQNGHWLVFSESNLPGWAITIDGQPTKAVTANYLFQAVYVPKGEHEVRWEYKGI